MIPPDCPECLRSTGRFRPMERIALTWWGCRRCDLRLAIAKPTVRGPLGLCHRCGSLRAAGGACGRCRAHSTWATESGTFARPSVPLSLEHLLTAFREVL
jgi:hypothetical protein